MMYDKVIQKNSSKELGKFILDHIDVDAEIKTDSWFGDKSLLSKFKNLKQVPSGKRAKIFITCIE